MKSIRIALGLAIAYLRHRPLATALNILMLALGVATIIALMLTLHRAEQRMERDAAGIDLVIGAKGSPLQLVLSSVYQMDVPTGNISMSDAALIVAEPMVRRAIPLALGDSYKGFRIVGTNPDYAALYGAELAQGAFWKKRMQAVMGAEAAAATGAKLGNQFASSHGLTESGSTHADHPFDVVGILAPTGTVIDRLVLTSVASVWAVHDHSDDGAKDKAVNKAHAHGEHEADAESAEGKEITAYLIQYASPLAAVAFPRMVNASTAMQAASPAMEGARLFSLLGIGVNAMKLFAVVMIVCAGLGIFVGLMGALHEQRADLALLRLLGASPVVVTLTVCAQAMLLGSGGVILGIALGHAAALWIALNMQATHRIDLGSVGFLPAEWGVMVGALALALVASLFPAWRAYREATTASLSNR